MKEQVAVLGGGSWGTALARLLALQGYDTLLYMRNETLWHTLETTGENVQYLPGVIMPDNLRYTTDLHEAVSGRRFVVFAVPTGAFRAVLETVQSDLRKDAILINVAKGIETETLERPSEIAESIVPDHAFVCLSGPSHAEEVARDMPTTVTVASHDEEAALAVQQLFNTISFRVYTNPDLIGVELGGALKNIIALGAGICDGFGYGDNTKAALMTRGIVEMARFGVALGAKPQTFYGLAGIGDLIVTCTSPHSRNRRAGILLGQGKTLEEAVKEVGMVVEGAKTTWSVYQMNQKLRVDMPITTILHQILYEGLGNEHILDRLMTRDPKDETEGLWFGQ